MALLLLLGKAHRELVIKLGRIVAIECSEEKQVTRYLY
jgi:hypothetical protein